MLYIPQNTRARITAPKVSAEVATATTLRLRSTIDLTDTEIAVEVVEVSPLWIAVDADIPVMQSGEYGYELRNGNEVVSRGVAVVQELENNAVEYEQEETYIQYE